MSARRLWAIAWKEFLHVGRDPRSLAMGIAMPLILLLLFGYALTLDVDRVPLVVWDRSQTPTSREYVSRFAGSRYFDLLGQAWDYREVERALDTGEAMLALVIPREFAVDLAAGRATTVQLLVEGSDASRATLGSAYAEVTTQGYSQEVVLRQIQRAGRRLPTEPFELRARVWYNNDLEFRHYLVPGLIAVIMMIVAALLTSLTVAREWERGTMEQLIATPVRGSELVLGKLVPYFAIGMLDVTVAVVVGDLLFAVPLRGSVVLVFAMAAVFLVGTLALGVWISVVAKNQMLANQLAMVLTFVPAFLLSGLVFAIANMPTALQVMTNLIPARHFVAFLRGVYLKGVGLEVLAAEAGILVAFAVALLALANARFRKRL